MKLLAVVVLYYPDEEVVSNIASYFHALDQLVVWDNTPKEDQRKLNTGQLGSADKIIYMGEGKNLGIGKALNEAVTYGILHGFTHILTMDQDSSFKEGDFVHYLNAITSSLSTTVGCYIPQICEPNTTQEVVSNLFSAVDIGITSGSIFPLQFFSKVGLFRDDFFIDAIDVEFCFRLRKHGLEIVRVNNVKLHHILGNRILVPFLWGKLGTLNYSAIRTYYIMRNHIILRRLYPEYPLQEGFFNEMLYRRFVRILLVEKDKIQKLKAMFLGIYHGFQQKTGQYTIH